MVHLRFMFQQKTEILSVYRNNYHIFESNLLKSTRIIKFFWTFALLKPVESQAQDDHSFASSWIPPKSVWQRECASCIPSFPTKGCTWRIIPGLVSGLDHPHVQAMKLGHVEVVLQPWLVTTDKSWAMILQVGFNDPNPFCIDFQPSKNNLPRPAMFVFPYLLGQDPPGQKRCSRKQRFQRFFPIYDVFSVFL